MLSKSQIYGEMNVNLKDQFEGHIYRTIPSQAAKRGQKMIRRKWLIVVMLIVVLSLPVMAQEDMLNKALDCISCCVICSKPSRCQSPERVWQRRIHPELS